jgi:hypothetical protein
MKSVIVKGILTVGVWAAAITVRNVFLPLTANQAALTQFQDAASSYTNFAAYNAAVSWGTGILVVLTILLFVPDLLKIFKFSKAQ